MSIPSSATSGVQAKGGQAGGGMSPQQRDAHATETAGAFWHVLQGDLGRNGHAAGRTEALKGIQFKLEDTAAAFRAGKIGLAEFDQQVAGLQQKQKDLHFSWMNEGGEKLQDKRQAAQAPAGGEDEAGEWPSGPSKLNPVAQSLLSDTRSQLDALQLASRTHTFGGLQDQKQMADALNALEAKFQAIEAKHAADPSFDEPLEGQALTVAQAKVEQELRVESHAIRTQLAQIEADQKGFQSGSNMTTWR